MKIFNTLSRRKEEFIPLEPGKVRMYVCGPTVYDFIHIGNTRPMIFFDSVRRYLEYKGYEVNYVSNFTDVDDKIIKRALADGVEASVISERFTEECKKDMEGMRVRPATTHPKATEEIDGMLEMIRILIDKGFAYEVNGTVYYRVKRFKRYGELSGKNLDDLISGNRTLLVTGEDEKENPGDFVLWKPKKEGEPYWESPWGQGRPGWHIECSVMSKKYLGEQIDIHGGGEDLIFPHHENEIAQSEAVSEKPFARYWMHNAFLNIDNKKMSKSLGNSLKVRDIANNYDLKVLRFFMLSAHYRSPLNYSGELMEAAKNGLERIENGLVRLRDEAEKCPAGKATEQGQEALQGFRRRFEEAMEDDFNTADAISVLFELIKYANTLKPEETVREDWDILRQTALELGDILGIGEPKAELLDSAIEALIAERQEARKAKNYARADEIRKELAEQGILLEDTKDGVKWKKA
ncbi:MAG: cysteine--tRNA ligase [Lachnospiraceae bacterium]|nr:cysteine--tRNA ligase [Lachnospiraceae bacterium]